MLKALIKTRLQMAWQAAFTIGGRRKNRRLMQALIVVLMVYAAISLAVMFGMFFSSLVQPFSQTGLDWFYFALAGVSAFALCFVSSIFMAQPLLFQARDNDLLLSMPIPPGMILFSRMAVLLFFNFLITLMVLAPAAIAWAVRVPMRFTGWAYFALVCLALPFMAVALSSLLGWGLAVISVRLRRKSLVITLLSILLMLGYLALISRMNVILARLVQQGRQIADAFERVLFPAYHLGKAIAEGNGISFLILLLCALAPFAIVWLVLQRSFISIATSNRGAVRTAYVERPLKSSSPVRALIMKELRLFFQNPMYMLNSGFGLIFMLALPIVLLVQPDLLAPILSQYDIPSHLIGLVAAGVMCLLASTVLISAPSIALEGKSLWIAQSLPVSAGQVLLSKAYAHMAVCLPVVLVSGLALGLVLRLPALYVLFSVLLPSLVAALMGLIGVFVNLKMPKFDWNTPTEAVKQSASVIVTMVIGFLVVALPAALFILALANTLSPTLFLALYALALLMLGGAARYRLKYKSARDFLALGG
ncbi:MAG: hypothetical protein PHP02_01875 [Eubacteriales bacterium]|nr:hypothetical protein [Eubacteriales bacterium]